MKQNRRYTPKKIIFGPIGKALETGGKKEHIKFVTNYKICIKLHTIITDNDFF